MGVRTSTLVPVIGLGAFAAGLLVGFWVGGTPLNPGPAPEGETLPGRARTSPLEEQGARATSSPGGRASGRDPAPGVGVSSGAATAEEAASLAAAGTSSSRPSSPAAPGSSSGGAVVPGNRTGRPASTSVTEEPAIAPEITDGDPGDGPDSPARSGALPPYTLPEKISGRLLDALTGQPIPGARVSLEWELSDGTVSSSLSADLKEDGTFVLEPRDPMRSEMARMVGEGGWLRDRFGSPEEALASLEYSITGRAKGYETLEKGDPGAEVRLGLVPEGLDRLPGTVRVEARRRDGSAFPGRMLVDFGSGDRGRFSQWAFPEADGTFLLTGVPAGKWGVRASGKNNTGRDVVVPEAGEVRAMVQVPREGLEEAADAPRGAPREVEVGLGGRSLPAASFLRAEARPGLFFRVEVVGGRALFAALPAGTWTFVLQAPGQSEERFAAAVPAGEGRLGLEFPASGDGQGGER